MWRADAHAILALPWEAQIERTNHETVGTAQPALGSCHGTRPRCGRTRDFDLEKATDPMGRAGKGRGLHPKRTSDLVES